MLRICFCPTINFREKIFCCHILPSVSLEYLLEFTGIRIEWLFFELALQFWNREALEELRNGRDDES